jgi:hypothetical protein
MHNPTVIIRCIEAMRWVAKIRHPLGTELLSVGMLIVAQLYLQQRERAIMPTPVSIVLTRVTRPETRAQKTTETRFICRMALLHKSFEGFTA